MTLHVRVISQQPPGGRCNLYGDYAKALASHLDAEAERVDSTLRDAHGEGFPSLWFDDGPVPPADGVILMPDDLVAALEARGVAVPAALSEALEAALERMLEQGA